MEGKLDDLKGRIKEATGALLGDDELKKDGKKDQAAGRVKKAADEAVDKVREATDG